MIPVRNLRHGGQDIDDGNSGSRLLKPRYLLRDLTPNLFKEPVFQLTDGFLGTQYFGFKFFELRGDESLGIDQGLLPHVMVWHEMEIALGDLDIVAEDLIVSNLQGGDSRFLSLLCFQLKDPAFPFFPDRS